MFNHTKVKIMKLLIGEEALLLEYKPEKHKLALGGWGMFLSVVMPATILSDLKLRGKIDLIGDIGKRKKRMTLWVNPIDDTPTNIPMLDDVYNILKNHTVKGKKAISAAAKWMEYFGKKKNGFSNLEERMWDSLVERGVLKRKGKKTFELLKPEIRQEIIDRVTRAACGQEEPDARTTTLMGYIEHHFGWYTTPIKGRNKKLARELALRDVISFMLKWNVVVKKKQMWADAVSTFSLVMGGASQVTIRNYVEAKDLVLD